jgi:hypothetical protein
VYDLALEAHNPADEDAARRRVLEWPVDGEAKQIPIGVFYNSHREAYESCGRPGQSMNAAMAGTAPQSATDRKRGQSPPPLDVVKRALGEFE